MRGAVTLLALLGAATGCRQILGFESPEVASQQDAAADTPVPDTLEPDGPPADVMLQPVTLAFRKGTNGYTGTRDTFIEGGSPNVSNMTSATLKMRATDRHILIAFDGIFAVGRIPPGSPIMEAHLEIVCNNPGGAGMAFEILHSWQENVTFNTFGAMAGVSDEDIGASAVAAIPGNTTGTITLDVTSSLAAWSMDPQTNQGWLLQSEGAGDTQIQASEAPETDRPRLTVTYLAPGP